MLMNIWQILSDVAAVAPMVISICSIIAAVTPTPKDDEWLSKLYRFIDIMAINIGHAKK
jgi:hypothetical protein